MDPAAVGIGVAAASPLRRIPQSGLHVRAAIVVIVIVVVVGLRRLWIGAAHTPSHARIGPLVAGSDRLQGVGVRVVFELPNDSGIVSGLHELNGAIMVVELEHRHGAAAILEQPLGDEAAFDWHHLANDVSDRLRSMAMRRRRQLSDFRPLIVVFLRWGGTLAALDRAVGKIHRPVSEFSAYINLGRSLLRKRVSTRS